MKHNALVIRAEHWLKKTMKCPVIFTELVTYAGEIPDAIGFNHSFSILVECKTSKSDFHSDVKKRIRRKYSMGMGNHRYYLCQPEIILPKQVPEKWGLLWAYPKKIVVKKESIGFWSSRINKKERFLFYSFIRRGLRNNEH